MEKFIERTANDEEPMCRFCDNINNTDRWCMENCGGANFWNGYRRTEKIEDNEV